MARKQVQSVVVEAPPTIQPEPELLPPEPNVLPQKAGENLPAAMQQQMIVPGEVRNPVGAPRGKRLSTRIMEILQERSVKKGGRDTRFDDAAEAYVRQLEKGSIAHFKEILERTEGKVSQPVDLEIAIKQYVDTPVDGPEAP